eukprot:986251-Rhodomonas_salina.1
MAALLGKLDIRATAFKERMEDLDDFMHQENLPLDLRFRTRAFFEYGYNHSRYTRPLPAYAMSGTAVSRIAVLANIGWEDIPASIEELSTSLRTEVALHLYNDLITTVCYPPTLVLCHARYYHSYSVQPRHTSSVYLSAYAYAAQCPLVYPLQCDTRSRGVFSLPSSHCPVLTQPTYAPTYRYPSFAIAVRSS